MGPPNRDPTSKKVRGVGLVGEAFMLIPLVVPVVGISRIVDKTSLHPFRCHVSCLSTLDRCVSRVETVEVLD